MFVDQYVMQVAAPQFGGYTPWMRTDQSAQLVPKNAELQPLTATLAAAFQDDPGLSYVVPDQKKRRTMLPHFFAVMAEQSFRRGEILASPAREAVSLWYPPGAVKDGPLDSLKDNLRLLHQFGRALPRGLRVADAMYAHHPKPQPHDYLRYVGVSPAAQGKGWGGALIRAGIQRAAERGRGVLLETATQSNVGIYQRLGFEISKEWEVPGGGPKFWTMIHPAP